MLKNNTFDEFLNKIGESLNLNIDPSSLDVKIFKCFYDLTSAISSKTETEVKSMFFENLRGNDLDRVMEFFDTYRGRGGDSDLYTFELFNSSEKSFLIKKGSLLNFENNSYKILQDTYVGSGLNNLICQQNGIVVDFNKPLFTKDGVICFGAENVSGVFKDVHGQFTSSVKLSTFNIQNDEIESDFEFKEKSKSIMQSFGMSNSFKIKSEIMENSDVKNVVITEENDLTKLTIIPTSLSLAKDTLEFSKEIVKYYKNGNVVPESPCVLEIELERVNQMLTFDKNADLVKDAISSFVIEYLSTNFNGSIQRSKVISLIQEAINLNAEFKNHDVSQVEVKYNFYSKDNYESPILKAKITNVKSVNENTVVTFGRIG
ncbi:MAG: hypothetical protein ACRC5F_09110 [Cetobacterium sp.]